MERLLYSFPAGYALCEDGRLVEYIDLQEETQSGDIVLGKIDRMMPGMKCAFADIGRKKDGFLPLQENSRSFTDGPVHSGDLTAVQIRREENGEKGAFLSRDLVIPGRYLILMPKNRYIGISSRIQDEETRERLKETGKRIAENRYGLVMRASSETAPEKEIQEEADFLAEQWRLIRERMKTADKPGEVLFSPDPEARMVDDYAISASERFQVPEMPEKLRKQLDASRNRKVSLPCGGNLVIDRCEAMTVIDVNSASAVLPGNREKNITAVNLEACSEAAVQIRLRDIAGIILIDFIDMDEETDRSLVLERLKEVFSPDRRKTVIHGWTKLGILEMTRKRI